MDNNKSFQTKMTEVFEFNKIIENYVVVNNNINLNENLSLVYNQYNVNLSNLFRDFLYCDAKNKNKQQCINDLSLGFNKLRSDISKLLAKQ
jgi:hypothetical protein